jgi:hypothetical protein
MGCLSCFLQRSARHSALPPSIKPHTSHPTHRYGEYYDSSQGGEGIRAFHSHLPRLLKPGGVYSYFNGFASDNLFFHMVTGRCV